MEIVIFLAAVSAANHFVGVEGFFPTSIITMLPYGGYQITFGSSRFIEWFEVHLNKNNPITVGDRGDTDLFINNHDNGTWIYRNRTARLRARDLIYYWTKLRFNGHNYTSTVKNCVVEPGNRGRFGGRNITCS